MPIPIRFSRHAKNRMRLYGIGEEAVKEVINFPDGSWQEEGYFIAYRTFKKRFLGLPLKVVYTKERNTITVVTVYPVENLSEDMP